MRAKRIRLTVESVGQGFPARPFDLGMTVDSHEMLATVGVLIAEAVGKEVVGIIENHDGDERVDTYRFAVGIEVSDA